MRRLLLALIFCLVVLVWPTLAQDTPTLSSLELAIWPEFDRPEVLVIYRGLFAPDTPLPVPVEIRIPGDVGQPTAVAYVDEGGQRFNQEYTTRVEGDWLVVAFELDSLGFQLEYYDVLAADSAGQREYAYAYTADYPITALDLEFQEPPTAKAFTLDPPADSVVTESDGLTYHLVQAASVEQGETRTWTLTYQKDNSDLTVEAFLQPETPAPPGGATGAEEDDNSAVLIFLVAFVALVAVGAGAFWLGRRVQPISEPAPPPSRPRKRRGSGRGTRSQQQRSPVDRDEAPYCYRCGAELRSDSDFCHKCGAAVRRT